jgi:CheY-like chemotaxis protein
MSPKEAKVFYVEDDEDSREIGIEFLQGAGHRVVEQASSLGEALGKVAGLGKKGVNVAVVDGNLHGGDRMGNNDGERVTKEIKGQHPGIKVVGHALDRAVGGADVNSTKYDGGAKLVETVTKI